MKYKITMLQLIGIVFLIFLAGFAYSENERKISLTNEIQNDTIIKSCYKGFLESSALCLNDEVKTWHSYNKENENKTLTFEELKTMGGVCHHYADFYTSVLKGYGYKTETVNIYGDKKGHSFTVAWTNDLTKYCIIDQITTECFNLK
jgi:hypothetical protein